MKTTLLCLAFAALSSHAAAATAPGGQYVGYYQEDARTNPEDPTPGAFVLTLPDQDASFDGAMFFTFVGCQKSNVGKVSGKKAGLALNGTWSGMIDASTQSGPYSGTYDPVTGSYAGVYSNAGGKQFKNIEGCIQYYIGANGTWEMFPVEKNQPAAFKVGVDKSTLNWSSPPGAAMALVYVLDPLAARTPGANPIKFQTLMPAQAGKFSLGALGLDKGKEYIAVALVNNAKSKRIAFGSKRFVAQ
jgi:hypothetical protein